MRTAPLTLLLVGLLGVAFFWLTDPRLGVGTRLDGRPSSNVVDAIHIAWPGTVVGLAGSAGATLIGATLLARRST